jgi:ankyrin repeat protein
VVVVAELTADEVEKLKRAKAEADGNVIDLTALSPDKDEEAAVARGEALRATHAAADAAAAKKAALAALGPRLIAAAAAGDADAVSRLLKQGADVASADDHGSTALHFAARIGRVEAVKALLASGASASHKNESSKTPVHHAVSGLVERGDGNLLALFALVESLANDDDALVALVSGDDSPLCAAARAGEKLAIKYLVLRGCGGVDYAAVREALRPAVYVALENGASDCVEYLRGLPVQLRSPDGGSLCLLAYDDHTISALEKSLTEVVSFSDGNLTLNCKGKMLDKDKLLGFYQLLTLALAPDDGAPARRDCCFHILSDAVADEFFRAVADGSVADVARCMKDSGIDLNMHDSKGIIQHHAPGRSGCPDEHWLTTRNARPTALWDAAHMGRVPLVTKLLSLGADVSTRLLVNAFPSGSFTGSRAAGLDCSGETPLHAAARLRSSTIAVELIKAGADVNARCGAEHPGVIIADATPLYWAVRCGNLPMVELLLANGADPCALHAWECGGQKLRAGCSSSTWTLVHLLAGPYLDSTIDYSSDEIKTIQVALVSALVTAGADVDAVDQNGRTALHLAAHYNFVFAIDALLAAGADAGVRDKSGKTPLAEAMHCNHGGGLGAVFRLSSLGL